MIERRLFTVMHIDQGPDLLCLNNSPREAIKDKTFLAGRLLHGFVDNPNNQVIRNKLSLTKFKKETDQLTRFLLAFNCYFAS
jgi:hypothetical protein